LRAARAAAAAGEAAEPSPQTEEPIEELSTRIEILARQIELETEAAAGRARSTPQPAAGPGGFSVQSPDGSFRLRLRGYVQSDGRFFPGDRDERGVDTFALRRVRPIVEATMYRMFDVRIMPDFGGGTTALQDAYIEARLRPALRIRAGKFKPPFGLERLMSATDLPFVERALPTSLAPNRDLGLMVHGDLAGGTLAYALGAFNGVTDGGSADLDTQDAKEVVGRVFAQPWRARRGSAWQGLGAGLAASYGTQRGTSAASTGLPVFRTSGQTSFFAYRGDDPLLGAVLADGARTRISAQGHYYRGAFGILGEHVRSSQPVRRSTSRTTLDNAAWQLAGTWVLTGEPASYRGVTPRTPFDLQAGTWGAFELTARYSVLELDADAFPIFANPTTAAADARAWAAGLNWMLNAGVKLQVNYERTAFGAAGPARRRAEHDLLTRIQFGF
jgi:phosphate-selective porin OprO/OprP